MAELKTREIIKLEDDNNESSIEFERVNECIVVSYGDYNIEKYSLELNKFQTKKLIEFLSKEIKEIET
ncbi:MAG: hypothetical protein EZS26_000769 [Candidatus Ordinivivax streblomastigis]|uniref:Uncharacterized protein n=1 Tax=Candidatus Ordinivivax streblomastigis TaxID=2540710 RepID=A0A5M8P4B0_9BACT|nr:MAG: hypothetical protein EZS26_000769 [Candidatus Ordinivivax streblomastigis]